jgi:hypothetical protein
MYQPGRMERSYEPTRVLGPGFAVASLTKNEDELGKVLYFDVLRAERNEALAAAKQRSQRLAADERDTTADLYESLKSDRRKRMATSLRLRNDADDARRAGDFTRAEQLREQSKALLL